MDSRHTCSPSASNFNRHLLCPRKLKQLPFLCIPQAGGQMRQAGKEKPSLIKGHGWNSKRHISAQNIVWNQTFISLFPTSLSTKGITNDLRKCFRSSAPSCLQSHYHHINLAEHMGRQQPCGPKPQMLGSAGTGPQHLVVPNTACLCLCKDGGTFPTMGPL